MLDRYTHAWTQAPLLYAVKRLPRAVTPDHLTLAGFIIGIVTLPMLAVQWYIPGLFMILLNRIFDGLDGALARIGNPTDAGGFLDITLDFVFYSAVIFGFALADPARNALAAAFLIFSFVCSGTSFLSFALMADRHNIEKIQFASKSLYYMGGLTEGTETIVLLVAICLFPAYFPVMAWGFGSLCLITAITRIYGGYGMLLGKEKGKNL